MQCPKNRQNTKQKINKKFMVCCIFIWFWFDSCFFLMFFLCLTRSVSDRLRYYKYFAFLVFFMRGFNSIEFDKLLYAVFFGFPEKQRSWTPGCESGLKSTFVPTSTSRNVTKNKKKVMVILFNKSNLYRNQNKSGMACIINRGEIKLLFCWD